MAPLPAANGALRNLNCDPEWRRGRGPRTATLRATEHPSARVSGLQQAGRLPLHLNRSPILQVRRGPLQAAKVGGASVATSLGCASGVWSRSNNLHRLQGVSRPEGAAQRLHHQAAAAAAALTSRHPCPAHSQPPHGRLALLA